MKRRLFPILSALSLLLSVAVVLLWLRSMLVGDTFYRHFYRDEAGFTMWNLNVVVIGRGGVAFHQRVYPRSPAGPIPLNPRFGPWPFHQTMKPEYPYFDYMHKPKLGFVWARSEQRLPNGGMYRQVQLVVPFWAILLLVLPPALLTVRRHVILARRKPPGLCPSCGYDLRATPKRCPECGTTPATTA